LERHPPVIHSASSWRTRCVAAEPRQAHDQPNRTLLGWANHDTWNVTVFYNSARAIERNSNSIVTRGQILGHAIAHEMGHFLPASDAHSGSTWRNA
jgi:hypothetical protein